MFAVLAVAGLYGSREEGSESQRLSFEYLSSALSSLYLRGNKQTKMPFAGKSQHMKSELCNEYL